MSHNNKCSGCINELNDDESMRCTRCFKHFHFACVNISSDSFGRISDASKNKWICPACRCSEPKRDNTHTPVRSSSTAINSGDENVTLRTKQRPPTKCSCITADDIRKIIREEIHSALDYQLLEIKNKITDFDQSLNFLSQEYDTIRKELDTQKNSVISLQKENELLRTNTREMAQRLRQIDQQSRACNIEINCVPEHRNENLVNLVQQLSKVIKCPVKENDIFFCSRTAKMNTSTNRPRSILVRFSSARLRDTFLAASIDFNKKNVKDKLNSSHLGIAVEKKSPVYVVENLSPENKALHAAARLKAKELSYKYVWVRNGRIYLRKTDDSKFILIHDSCSLANLS